MPIQSGWQARHARTGQARMTAKSRAAENLAAKLLATPWSEPNLNAALDYLSPLKRLARATLFDELKDLAVPYPPSHQSLKHFLLTSPSFPTNPRPIPITLAPPLFAPAQKFKNLATPKLPPRENSLTGSASSPPRSNGSPTTAAATPPRKIRLCNTTSTPSSPNATVPPAC